MLVQAGANCNVFSYNYSREQDWNYNPKLGPDLCLHGNYPFGNLFEQNVVCQISADNEHGVNGPYNTFLRNWVSVPDISRVKFHGPIWLDNAPHTAVLGNETWMGPGGNPIDETGSTTSLSVDIYGYFNDQYRTHAYMAAYESDIRLFYSALADVSYYYSERPNFLSTSYTWPSLGPNYTTYCSQSIPSYDRYSNSIRTYNSNPTQWPPQPLAVYISGPTSLGYNETGTFTANPSGGSGTYTNYRWWWRNDAGGGVGPESAGFDNGIDYVPPGDYWYELTALEGQQTITIGKPDDFSLKCEVTDSDNNTATDIHSIIVGGGFAKAQCTNSDKIEIVAVPEQVELTGNYPNPFNPSTTIRFGLPVDSNVRLTIYSSTGQKVRNLVNGIFSKGYHDIMWDGKNQAGNFVSTGIYITELKAGNHRLIKKMVFAK